MLKQTEVNTWLINWLRDDERLIVELQVRFLLPHGKAKKRLEKALDKLKEAHSGKTRG